MKLEIYRKVTCPFCQRAEKLLESKGVDMVKYDVIEEPKYKEESMQRSGGRTSVPQIFIDGRYIGGCDDLHELEAQGKLDPLLGLNI